MGGVGARTGLTGVAFETVERGIGRARARGGRGHRAQGVLPVGRAAGEHRRRDLRQRGEGSGRLRHRAQDQVRRGGPHGVQVRCVTRADAGRVVQDGAQVRRLGDRGADHPALQTESAQRVERGRRQRHDALRISAHLGVWGHARAGRVADLPRCVGRLGRGRFGRAGFVRSAVVAQHAGAGDPGGAGDRGARFGTRHGLGGPTGRQQGERGHDTRGEQALARSGERHRARVPTGPFPAGQTPSTREYDSL